MVACPSCVALFGAPVAHEDDPERGILVGESTYRATRHTVDYREAEPVDAKGKAESIPVWEPLRARSRRGIDVAHVARAPLVGRELELHPLRDALARARSQRSVQLSTLVGVPGIGKSRLVYELRALGEEPERATWRHGHCPRHVVVPLRPRRVGRAGNARRRADRSETTPGAEPR